MDIKVFIVRVFLLYHMLEIVHNKMLEKNSNFFFFGRTSQADSKIMEN